FELVEHTLFFLSSFISPTVLADNGKKLKQLCALFVLLIFLFTNCCCFQFFIQYIFIVNVLIKAALSPDRVFRTIGMNQTETRKEDTS
uniref:Uncharacterized protein n=1 Tax=Scophthalmus maximus TaxID=52904 RepID=A0A8D3DM68_SCOMX